MPKCNIPETEKIRLVWTHQEKRRRQPLKQNDGLVVPGKRLVRRCMDRHHLGRYEKYELTADMTESR